MPKTITQLPAALVPSRDAVVAVDNAAGTLTEKVALGQIADLSKPPQLNPPGMARMVTIRDSGTFSISARTSTGYAAVLWWDGSVQVLGAGAPASDITVSKAIPTTGNWIKSAPKEIFVWSCTSGAASQSGSLTRLACGNSFLASLDVGGLTALAALECNSNSLASLDVSQCTNLQNLDCGVNSITSLDVSQCTNLQTLTCGDNLLTSLDVSSAPLLEFLSCSSGSIASLNVSGCTNLQTLNCDHNSLTSLDVSGLTALAALRCATNPLTSLRAVGVPGYPMFGTWATSYTGYRGQGVQAMNCLLGAAALNQLYADLADNTATGSYALVAVFGNPGIASDDPSIATAKNWIVLGT